LGQDPSGETITLRTGRFGFYLQRGNNVSAKSEKSSTRQAKKKKEQEQPVKKEEQIRRVSIPRDLDPDRITLDQAVVLLSLPRNLGTCPKTEAPVTVERGRFGPFIRRGSQCLTIKKSEEIFSLDLQEATERLDIASSTETPKKRRATRRS
jgi:DNA topoisomerase-1